MNFFIVAFLFPFISFAASEDVIRKAAEILNKKNAQHKRVSVDLAPSRTLDSNVAKSGTGVEAQANLSPSSIQTFQIDEKMEKKSKLKNIILALDSENVKTLTSQNGAAYRGDIEGYQYLKTGYKLDDQTSVLMVNTWVQRWGYKENGSQTTYNDLQFRVTRSDLFSIGRMKFSGQLRAYLPTSRTSNYQDQVVHLRNYMLGVQELGKRWSLNVMLSPRYSVQENKDYVNANGVRVNTMEWAAFNTIGLKYTFSDKLSLDTAVGVYSVKSHNSETAHLQDYSTVAHYIFNPKLSLRGGVRSSLTTNIDTEGIELYDHNNMEYIILAALIL